VFNATFSNISAISWRPVLVVEEADVPGENHRPWASNWYSPFDIYKSSEKKILKNPVFKSTIIFLDAY
jgi:hypothetical protein